MRQILGALAFALTVTTITPAARADTPPGGVPHPRPVPDYDGRPEPAPDAGHILIWIPRVVLFPAYLVSEYLVRWPLGQFITWLEQEKVIQQAYGFFTFGSGGSVGIFPTALFDFGLRPSVGLYLFSDPLFHPDNRFRISVAYGGEDWLTLGAKDRIVLEDHDGGELIVRGGYSRRPDFPFYGIGPDARQSDETFYRLTRIEAAASIALRRAHAGVSAEVRVFADQRDHSGFDQPTEQYFATDEIAGYDESTLFEQRLDVYADSRPQGETYLTAGSGIRIDAHAAHVVSLDDAEQQRFFRWGGETSFFLDLTGTRRVLGLNVEGEAIERLGDGPVPLSALIQLGGTETMRGFYLGRFVGQSAMTTTLDYRWPIASFLDAELFAGVGNVFGEHFDGFDVEKLAGDAGFALRTNTSRDLSFDIVVGVGTRQFDRGPLDIESFRLTIGTNRGF